MSNDSKTQQNNTHNGVTRKVLFLKLQLPDTRAGSPYSFPACVSATKVFSSTAISSYRVEIRLSRYQLLRHSSALMASSPIPHLWSEIVIFAPLKTRSGSADMAGIVKYSNAILTRSFQWGSNLLAAQYCMTSEISCDARDVCYFECRVRQSSKPREALGYIGVGGYVWPGG
jgi:hypothetical protein